MTGWDDLERELDRWGEDGETATFWWRDDDAGPDDGRLAGFLDQRRALGVPLALAVVPDWLDPGTAGLIAGDPGSTALQHGVSHADRTRGARRKAELCTEALESGLAEAMGAARAMLADVLAGSFVDVMVPPWNRIDPGVAALLPGLGFAGLSGLGPRAIPGPGGIAVVNVHVDIIDWKRTRGFAGDEACLDAALGHLRARRAGLADKPEPTGLMTHHRVHDGACRLFVERFAGTVRDHPAACWLEARDILGAGPAP